MAGSAFSPSDKDSEALYKVRARRWIEVWSESSGTLAMAARTWLGGQRVSIRCLFIFFAAQVVADRCWTLFWGR